MDRYSISWSNTMKHDDEGEYVEYKDAQQAIATARAEALREDVAGKVWELVFPHLKEGGKCKLYDEMRRMYPAPLAILTDKQEKNNAVC